MSVSLRFVPGAGTAVVAAHAAALVLAPADSRVVLQLHEQLSAGASLPAVLAALSRSDASLPPPFALAIREDQRVRVAQRGPVEVHAVLAGGSELRLTDPDVSTWLEQTWTSPLAVTLGQSTAGAVHRVAGCVVPAVGIGVLPNGGSLPPSVATWAAPTVSEAPAMATPAVPAGSSGAAPTLVFGALPTAEVTRDVVALPPAGGTDTAPPIGPLAPDAEGLHSSDHDGHTAVRPRIPGTARSAPESARPTRQTSAVSAKGPVVLAGCCPSGHPNPTTHTHCRECQQPILDRTHMLVPRPSLGVLRLSTNHTVQLTGPLVIGRQPSIAAPVEGEMPLAVKVDHSELSRSHATVAIVDWVAYIVDNGSMNGTRVVVPGQAPERLRNGERMRMSPGTVVDLGGVVTFRYDPA